MAKSEIAFWPNLVVGIVGRSEELSCVVELVDGEYPPSAGCPSDFDRTRYLCTCAFHTSPADKTVTVRLLDQSDRIAAEVTVDLAEFNKCGRNLAYEEFDAGEGTWSSVRYLNPCNGL